ncbi:MAG: GNAT family N-acetyltransferase [Oscillospiraceae bacterium]|nr:GNAT family N-acetyltransferase [Oscillospiraceae bacterium]
MIKLIDVNEENWLDFRRLSVSEAQKGFLDSPLGILARGYVYRHDRARVIGIEEDDTVIGVALVRDLDDEPACYDLQQFMIDARFQGKGCGTAALRMILSELEKERKYDCVEVCVKKTDAAALRVYEKTGFIDTGYIDEEVPDALNLMYNFSDHPSAFSDVLISDFSDPLFQAAFQTYFSELGITVKDWDGLFREMNDEGDNQAFVRTATDGSVIGFIQFKPTKFTSWFFEETCGFIREFWISKANRNAGHGSALLRLAESCFKEHGMHTSILTTDTAGSFYLKHGYRKAPGCKAKNEDEVFVKLL